MTALPLHGTARPRHGPNGQAPGAVVIGGDHQGLGIAGASGSTASPCASSMTRPQSRVRRASCSTSSGSATYAANRRYSTPWPWLAAGLGRPGWVLYPTRDENVAALAANRDALGRLQGAEPGLASIRSVWDKRETYRLAEQLSIPIPRTWFPRAEADLAAIDMDGPLVVKPAIKEHFFYTTHAKAWRADTPAELASSFRRAAEIVEEGEVIVQELIPGGGQEQYAYCALFRDGHAIASMTVRRRRQHPSDFGRASTYVETICLPDLADPSIRFLRAISYYGLVELEFKHDPRDGAYKLLDVNARTWGYHTLGRAAGVDFPYLMFRDQVGERVDRGACPARRPLGPARNRRAECSARYPGRNVAVTGLPAHPSHRQHRGGLLPPGSPAGSL